MSNETLVKCPHCGELTPKILGVCSHAQCGAPLDADPSPVVLRDTINAHREMLLRKTTELYNNIDALEQQLADERAARKFNEKRLNVLVWLIFALFWCVELLRAAGVL